MCNIYQRRQWNAAGRRRDVVCRTAAAMPVTRAGPQVLLFFRRAATLSSRYESEGLRGSRIGVLGAAGRCPRTHLRRGTHRCRCNAGPPARPNWRPGRTRDTRRRIDHDRQALPDLRAPADPLREAHQAGMPVYGSCAGMIMLAEEIADPAKDLGRQPTADVRRTGHHRAAERLRPAARVLRDGPGLPGAGVQRAGPGPASAPVHAVFIRGPWVERVGQGVEVLATVEPSERPTRGLCPRSCCRP